MGLKTEKLDKLLEVFYEYPAQRFTVRELARRTKLPKSTIQNYLVRFRSFKLITQNNEAADTLQFKTMKLGHYMDKIVKSGLIEYLSEQLTPSAIVLFGSFRKGESVKESDIDLFIETTSIKQVNLTKFEKKLGHSIQLFREKSIHKLPLRLFGNVLNGIVLYGVIRYVEHNELDKM